MLTLKQLKQTYVNSHPDYEQLMNRADITDKKLNKIKREILQPYLEEQKLEGRVIVYKEKYAGFVVISDVEMTEKGFKASIQALDPLDQPYEHHKHIEGSRWKIGGPWNMLMCNTTSIGCFYVGWNIWPEASFTKYIEEIYLSQGKQAAFSQVMQTLY
jgi:hypothetical protein